MTYGMNDDQLFFMKEFIDGPVIAYSQLEHSLEFSRKRFEIGIRKIFH
jgi:hypothetical protein